MKNNFFQKVGVFTVGILTTKVVAYGFDYAIYPFALYRMGLMWGFVAMFFLSLVINFLLVLLYDVAKTDIFGFEYIKELKNDEDKSKKGFLQRMIRKGKIPAFLALSVYDPFLATLFVRRSDKFDGFTRRDIWNLTLSGLIANIVWAPAVFAAVEGVKHLH